MTAVTPDATVGQPISPATEAATYSVGSVVNLTGATYRRIDYWCGLGLFGESRKRLGSGTHRRFTLDEVHQIYLAVRLIAAGFYAKKAVEIAAELVDHDSYSDTVADIFQLRLDIAWSLVRVGDTQPGDAWTGQQR